MRGDRPGAGAGRNEPLIELRDITKTYSSRVPVRALLRTNLTIRRGESLSIVGPSGSGKSTLLNVLGLLDAPTSGRYLLSGADVTATDELVRGSVRGQKFGFVFQAFHLLAHRSVVENVEVAMMYARVPRKERRERAEHALETLGLPHRLESDPRELSGGERQRAAIARAICLKPEVLFCDEPTGNLDTRNTEIVMDKLASLNAAGQTLVMVTHDLDLAATMRRTVIVRDGIIHEGDVGTIEASPMPGLERVSHD